MSRERTLGVLDLERRASAPIEVVAHPHCRGLRWAVNPDSRTVFYLAELPAAEAAAAVNEAVEALADHSARPVLRLIHSIPAARVAG